MLPRGQDRRVERHSGRAGVGLAVVVGRHWRSVHRAGAARPARADGRQRDATRTQGAHRVVGGPLVERVGPVDKSLDIGRGDRGCFAR